MPWCVTGLFLFVVTIQPVIANHTFCGNALSFHRCEKYAFSIHHSLLPTRTFYQYQGKAKGYLKHVIIINVESLQRRNKTC